MCPRCDPTMSGSMVSRVGSHPPHRSLRSRRSGRGEWLSARENQPDGRAPSYLRVDVELAAGSGGKAFHYPQSEAGALTSRFGREEGRCRPFYDLRQHTTARIRHGDLDRLLSLGFAAWMRDSPNGDGAAARVRGIADEVEQCELQLVRVKSDRERLLVQFKD
jgi:hypothetical protein